MYKKTCDSRHYIGRAANHSTKGSRTGLVTVLPPSAQPEFEMYLDLAAQRDELLKKLDAAAERYALAQKNLTRLHPLFQQYSVAFQRDRRTQMPPACKIAKEEVRQAKSALESLRRECAFLRKAMSASYRGSYEKTFTAVARAVLPQDVFDKIESIVFEQIGKPRKNYLADMSSIEETAP